MKTESIRIRPSWVSSKTWISKDGIIPGELNQWADQVQREKIFYLENWEMRKRLNHESHVRTSQEIKELRRIHCEEANQVRNWRLKNCPYDRKEIQMLWVDHWSSFKIYRIKRIHPLVVPGFIFKYWNEFVFNIVIAGLVINGSRHGTK